VAVLGVFMLREGLSAAQLFGVATLMAGALLYFGMVELGPMGPIGLAIAGAGALANALSAVLTRALARNGAALLGGTLAYTSLSMGLGGILLLAAGVVVESPALPSAREWALVAWLAMANTAFAFTLWNHTLRTLTAVESSVLNNTMLVQIAVLAWLFLGEALTARQIAGLAAAAAGALVVQVAPRPRRTPEVRRPAAGAAPSSTADLAPVAGRDRA
jgi:drug/metabolite transporter (DMT)-like permease